MVTTPPKKNTASTPINKAMASELRAERAAAKLTLDELVANSGVALSTLKRVLAGTIDVNMPDLAMLAKALGDAQGKMLTIEELVERAVKRAGGYDVVYADLPQMPENAVSDVPTNVTPIRKRVEDMTVDEIEAIEKKAATRDPEMDTDEHFD